MPVPEQIKEIIDRLSDFGYECYLVGGCVRDTLMGKTPHDYDLTTSALPEQMQTVFADRRIIETGLKHGTLTLLTDIGGVEITTYRVDGEYKDNRRPETVSFTPNLSEDLARRDFTVNAMAMSPDGETVDLYGGREDITNRVIRCVGMPEQRFGEDALRILRALRFASVLDFEIAESTADAIHSMFALLNGISAERIREELFKLICGNAAQRIMTEFADVITHIIPQIPSDQYQTAVNRLKMLPPDPVLRMSVLLACADCDGVMRALKCSREQIKTADDYVKVITSRIEPTATYVAILADGMGLDRLKIALDAAFICNNPTASVMKSLFNDLVDRGICLNRSDLEVSGTQLVGIGIPKGKAVGEMLNALFSAVAEGECPNQTEQLLEYAKLIKAD